MNRDSITKHHPPENPIDVVECSDSAMDHAFTVSTPLKRRPPADQQRGVGHHTGRGGTPGRSHLTVATAVTRAGLMQRHVSAVNSVKDRVRDRAVAVDVMAMEILLRESIERLRSLSVELGYGWPADAERPGPWIDEIEALRRDVEPMRFPAELDACWANWDLTELDVLTDASFWVHSPLRAAEERRLLLDLEFPRVLLPFAKAEQPMMALELATASHPGGRLFQVDFHGDNITVIGLGVSGMIDLFTSAINRTRTSERPNPYQEPVSWDIYYSELLPEANKELGGLRVDEHDRTSWPQHWLDAERFDHEWLQLKGPTHTVHEFDLARATSWPLTGVPQGTWKTRVAGGPLNGSIGHLTDRTGQVQIFIPNGCPHAGLGPGRQCEIEVIATPETGDHTNALLSACDMMAAPPTGDAHEEILRRLERELAALDVSIVALAVRPIR